MGAEHPSPQARVYVDKIHLLVHPGYALFGAGQASSEQVDDKHADLLDRYVQQAQIIADRTEETRSEVMLVFHTTTDHKLQERTHEHLFLIQQYRKMQQVLQDRIFFLSDLFMDTTKGIDKYGPKFDTVRHMARKAGYSFRKDTVNTEAYGETLGKCVPSTAHNFNTYFDLRHPTVIKTGLTNYAKYPEKERETRIKSLQERIQSRYHRVVFD